MKHFVTLVLILLLAGLGPVSGAIAHAHEVHPVHGGETVEHPISPVAAVRGSLSHHDGDEQVVVAQPGHQLGHAALGPEQGTPAGSEGSGFHVHTTVDGAPVGLIVIKFLTTFAAVPRRLVNSNQVIGPELPILQRPPRQIL